MTPTKYENLSPFAEYCRIQLSRLTTLKFSSTLSEAAWASLRQLLEKHCESKEHVKEVIEQCSMRAEMVSGYDIVEIAKATASAAHAAPSGECRRCHGTGWVHETRLIRGNKYDYAGRCGCWRTQEMAS